MTLCLVLTAAAQHALRNAGPHCYAYAQGVHEDGLFAVTRLKRTDGTVLGHGILLDRTHPLSNATDQVMIACYRAPASAHGFQMFAAWRAQTMRFSFLKELVPALELAEGGIALTYVPDHAEHGVPEFAGWWLTKTGAAPVDVECEPADYAITTLEPRWPARLLQDEHVVMIGAGTIGSATALALGSYGVGQLTLIDPDRLRYGNLKRLPYDPDAVGRFKVDVVAAAVRRAWPDTHVTALHLDAEKDTAELRSLLPGTSLVVCTADGVLPRRVAGHLARRAGLDTILGCVLDDGAVIEVLRLRALIDAGCLQCQRAALAAERLLEADFDPEADLHRPYGDGLLHKPMTAVGGDLQLAGAAVAKVAVSTLLHNVGKGVHTLPGETLLISLRASDVTVPYGDQHAFTVQWLPGAPPRPGCFTCASTAPAPATDPRGTDELPGDTSSSTSPPPTAVVHLDQSVEAGT